MSIRLYKIANAVCPTPIPEGANGSEIINKPKMRIKICDETVGSVIPIENTITPKNIKYIIWLAIDKSIA